MQQLESLEGKKALATYFELMQLNFDRQGSIVVYTKKKPTWFDTVGVVSRRASGVKELL